MSATESKTEIAEVRAEGPEVGAEVIAEVKAEIAAEVPPVVAEAEVQPTAVPEESAAKLKDETTEAKEVVPSHKNLLARIASTFKGVMAPIRSPKKDYELPAAKEVAKEVVAEAPPVVAATEEVVANVAELVQATENPVATTEAAAVAEGVAVAEGAAVAEGTAVTAVKEKFTLKVARRLSYAFKHKSKPDVPASKVAELPPTIEQPQPQPAASLMPEVPEAEAQETPTAPPVIAATA